MTVNPRILSSLRRMVKRSFDEAAANPTVRSICIHMEERANKAIEDYYREHPRGVTTAFAMAASGNPQMLEATLGLATAREENVYCSDVLCLPCRRGKMQDRVNKTIHHHPADLEAAADGLGPEVMESIRWIVTTLLDAARSEGSNENYKEKVIFAVHKTFPALIADAALSHDLQKALELAVKERDDYHKLADMLMDDMSNPASSK